VGIEATVAITVRTAQSKDAEIIADFNCRLALESENTMLNPAKVAKGVAALLSDRNKGVYYLACENDRILGQLAITLEWSDWHNGWYWWIQSVYTATDFRGRGVFRNLFEYVVSEAQLAGDVASIRLYVEQNNDRAQKTYQALGMKPSGYFVYDRPINRQEN
jgi:ribosomal protein S18 acetylase RimI-like enzyme